jgi:hypothetical protein
MGGPTCCVGTGVGRVGQLGGSGWVGLWGRWGGRRCGRGGPVGGRLRWPRGAGFGSCGDVLGMQRQAWWMWAVMLRVLCCVVVRGVRGSVGVRGRVAARRAELVLSPLVVCAAGCVGVRSGGGA